MNQLSLDFGAALASPLLWLAALVCVVQAAFLVRARFRHMALVTASDARYERLKTRSNELLGSSRAAHRELEHRDQVRAIELRLFRELSATDELTGVRNQRGFIDEATKRLERAEAARNAAAMLVIDLHGLVRINSMFGRDAGDSAIQDVVHILEETFSPDDLIGRLSGGSFAVLVEGAAPPRIGGLLACLLAAANRHNMEAGRPFPVTIGVGTAYSDGASRRSAAELIVEASKQVTAPAPACKGDWVGKTGSPN